MNTEDFKHWVPVLQPVMQRMAEQLLDCKQEAKDLVQDLFVELWQQRKRLDEVSNLPGYCVRLTQFRCIDRLRAAHLPTVPLDEKASLRADEPPDMEERERLFDELQRRMAGLSPEDQQLLRLHYWEQCSSSEIAKAFGISENNVRVRLHRIIQKLRRAETPDSNAKQMKDHFKMLLLGLLLAGAGIATAQNSPKEWVNEPKKDSLPNTFRLGGAIGGGWGYDAFVITKNEFDLQYERRLNRLLCLGGYVCTNACMFTLEGDPATDFYRVVHLDDTLYIGPGVDYQKAHILHLGAMARVDFTNMLKLESRWSFYLLGRLGLCYCPYDHFDLIRTDHSNQVQHYPVNQLTSEWSVGLCEAFQFSHHWGLYAELFVTHRSATLQEYDMTLRPYMSPLFTSQMHIGVSYRF